MGDRLATIDVGQKEGGAVVALSWGQAGSPSNSVAGTEAYHHAKFHLHVQIQI